MDKVKDGAERLTKVETKLDYVIQGQESNKIEHLQIMSKLEEMSKTTQERIEFIDIQHKKDIENINKENDKRYASKLSEFIIYGMCGAILLAFIYALIEGLL